MGYDEDTGQVQVEVEKWWQGSESNRRHRDFQSPALPSELPRHNTVSLEWCTWEDSNPQPSGP